MTSSMRIAVLVPCFNEEAAVATVVADFRKALPSAEIFVYDNNSTDRTVAVAREAGAEVRSERRQGKGHVVRRMFADIDADIYVLVDGDATYDAASAPRMIDALVSDHLDMVVGFRVDQVRSRLSARPSHRQLDADRLSLLGVRPGLQGYSVRLSRVLAALRQILPGAVGWFRDRNRAERPRARTGAAGRRDRNALLRPAGGIVQQAQHLARRFSDSRHHPETLPVGKAAALLHRHRDLSDAGFDRPRDPRHRHLSRGRPRSAAADRGAVDGPDDRGGAVGVVRAGARYGDARTPRDEAAGLFVPAPVSKN